MQPVTDTVKQRVREGVSLAVGVGVLGYQAARTRAEEAQTRVGTSVKDVRGRRRAERPPRGGNSSKSSATRSVSASSR